MELQFTFGLWASLDHNENVYKVLAAAKGDFINAKCRSLLKVQEKKENI